MRDLFQGSEVVIDALITLESHCDDQYSDSLDDPLLAESPELRSLSPEQWLRREFAETVLEHVLSRPTVLDASDDAKRDWLTFLSLHGLQTTSLGRLEMFKPLGAMRTDTPPRLIRFAWAAGADKLQVAANAIKTLSSFLGGQQGAEDLRKRLDWPLPGLTAVIAKMERLLDEFPSAPRDLLDREDRFVTSRAGSTLRLSLVEEIRWVASQAVANGVPKRRVADTALAFLDRLQPAWTLLNFEDASRRALDYTPSPQPVFFRSLRSTADISDQRRVQHWTRWLDSLVDAFGISWQKDRSVLSIRRREAGRYDAARKALCKWLDDHGSCSIDVSGDDFDLNESDQSFDARDMMRRDIELWVQQFSERQPLDEPVCDVALEFLSLCDADRYVRLEPRELAASLKQTHESDLFRTTWPLLADSRLNDFPAPRRRQAKDALMKLADLLTQVADVAGIPPSELGQSTASPGSSGRRLSTVELEELVSRPAVSATLLRLGISSDAMREIVEKIEDSGYKICPPSPMPTSSVPTGRGPE